MAPPAFKAGSSDREYVILTRAVGYLILIDKPCSCLALFCVTLQKESPKKRLNARTKI